MGAAARKKFPDKDSFSWTMLREASLMAVQQVCGQVTDRFPKVPKSVADVWNRFLVVREKHKKTGRFIYTWNGDAAYLSITDSLGGQHNKLRTFTGDRGKGELHYRIKRGGQIVRGTAKCDDAVFDDIELIRGRVFEAQSLTEELEDVATTAGPAYYYLHNRLGSVMGLNNAGVTRTLETNGSVSGVALVNLLLSKSHRTG
jgi:hypothetical protein